MMLNKNNLQLAQAASKEDSKYLLSGILVEPGFCVVTDGHQMIIVSTDKTPPGDFPAIPGFTPVDEFEPFVLPRQTALEIQKTIPNKANLPVLLVAAVGAPDENYVTLATTDLDTHRTFRSRKMTGQYPNWRQVVPKAEKSTFQITMGIDLMIRVLNQIKNFSDTATFRFQDADSAVRIDAANEGQTLTAIVMPIRNEKGVAAPEYAPLEKPVVAEPPVPVPAEVPEEVAA